MWFGNARHPATETVVPEANGPATGENTAAQVILTNGPSAQAVSLVGSFGIAVNTASPMSRGTRVWNGDAGTGVHRFTNRLSALASPGQLSPTANAVRPVAHPLGSSVRSGMSVGASQQNGYPSTGLIGDFGLSINALDMGKQGNFGYGG